METVTEKLLSPVIEERFRIDDNKKELTKISEKQSFIIIFSYLLMTFLILFSLYTTNSKHTLLLFFLQSAFFISIPFFFHNTRVFLKETVNYLARLI